MHTLRITIAAAIACVLLTSCATESYLDRRATWHSLPISGVSGLAKLDAQPGWLAVGDAKKRNELRALLIGQSTGGAPIARPLRWIGLNAVDLEALSPVPNITDTFIAVTSKGHWFAIRLQGDTVRVIRHGELPHREAIDELEGFSIARIGSRHLAIWGNRGDDEKPGRIFWTEWNPAQFGVSGPVQAAEIRMPWPTANVRHISDLRLDSAGRLVVASASDPGDNGPFASAIWDAGRFEWAGSAFAWRPRARPVLLFRESPGGHKVEAIAAGRSHQLIVASDDENLGSAIRLP